MSCPKKPEIWSTPGYQSTRLRNVVLSVAKSPNGKTRKRYSTGSRYLGTIAKVKKPEKHCRKSYRNVVPIAGKLYS